MVYIAGRAVQSIRVTMRWMKVLAVAVVVFFATTRTVRGQEYFVQSVDFEWPRNYHPVQFNTSYPFQFHVSELIGDDMVRILCVAANGVYNSLDSLVADAPIWTVFQMLPGILATGVKTAPATDTFRETLLTVDFNINDPAAHPYITPYQTFPIKQIDKGLVSLCCEAYYTSAYFHFAECANFYWIDDNPDISSQVPYFHSINTQFADYTNKLDFTVAERARGDRMNITYTCELGGGLERTMYLNLPPTNSSYPYRFQFDLRRLADDDIYPLVDYVPKTGTYNSACYSNFQYKFQDAAGNDVVGTSNIFNAFAFNLKTTTNTPTEFGAVYLSGNVNIAMQIEDEIIGVHRNSTTLEFNNGEVRTVVRLNPLLFFKNNALTISVPVSNVLGTTSNLSPTPAVLGLIEGSLSLAPGIYNVSLHLQDFVENPPVTLTQVNVNISTTASLNPVILWPQSYSNVTDLITLRYRTACTLLQTATIPFTLVLTRVGENSTVRINVQDGRKYMPLAGGTYSVSFNATSPQLHYNTSLIDGELRDGVYDIFMTWHCAGETFFRFSNIVRNVRIDGVSEPPDLAVPPPRVLMRHVPYHIQLHPDPVPNSVKVKLAQTNCTAQWNVSFDPLTLVAQGTLDVTNLTGTAASCEFDPAFAVEMTASYAQMLRPTKILHGVARNFVLVDGQVTATVPVVVTQTKCSAGERWNGAVIAVLIGCATATAIISALAMYAYMRATPFAKMNQAYEKMHPTQLRR